MSTDIMTMPRKEWDALDPYEQAAKFKAGVRPVDVPFTHAEWNRLSPSEQRRARRKGLAP
jgi:hypothetical protein